MSYFSQPEKIFYSILIKNLNKLDFNFYNLHFIFVKNPKISCVCVSEIIIKN